MEFFALAEEDAHAFTSEQWLADPLIDIKLIEFGLTKLFFGIIIKSWKQVRMARFHLPEEWEDGFVSENELPEWFERLQVFEVICHQLILGSLVDHPLFWIIVEKTFVHFIIVPSFEVPDWFENTARNLFVFYLQFSDIVQESFLTSYFVIGDIQKHLVEPAHHGNVFFILSHLSNTKIVMLHSIAFFHHSSH